MHSQRYEEGLEAVEALSVHAPEDRDVLYLTALSQRCLGRASQALETLRELETHHPNYSRLHQERGHCFVQLRDATAAIEAFLRGVNINPALPASWSMLESLYRMGGQPENAALAAGHVATLRKLPPEVVAATSEFADADLEAAEVRVRAYLLKHGDHVEAMRLLARIGIARKVFDDAQTLLAAVLELAPNYRLARREYAEVLLEVHQYTRAQQQLERLLNEEPGNRTYQILMSAALVGLGQHDRAIEVYRSLIRGSPQDADLHLSIGHALKTLGRRSEAVDEYRAAIDCRADFGDAYWSLANLKTYRFTDAEITRLRAAQSNENTAATDRCHLSFALGKALEDQGDFEQSFLHYSAGNELKCRDRTYRPENIEDNARRQIEIFSAEFLAARRGAGAQEADPIFVVGLPRSGSTLIEQMLASHSRVEGTQELANIQQLVHSLHSYPQVLTGLGADRLRELGNQYLLETRAFRHREVPHFVDKMPNNFRHIGLIHLILPNARIIDARREPMACCFGNLKQLFAKGQEFTYSAESIARYYRSYLELMRHWDRVLPGRILRIFHEDVVDDLEGGVRRLLEFCGLEFEPQCVEFHKTQRSVRTASSEQVRQPLYREGMDHWKHFEPWLQPLKESLGDARERYRD